jgi:ATP:ADP antiporter, AAA family
MGLPLSHPHSPPLTGQSASPLSRLLGLQPTDERRTYAITALHFFLGAIIVFMQAPAFGLFVSEFGSQRLPFAYIAIAILVSALNLAYLRLSNRFPFIPLSCGVLLFLAAACVALWLGLVTPLRSAIIFILPVGFQLTINVTVLVLWPLAGRAFNLREAKRTFGVISGGNWVASLLVGLILAPLIAAIGTENLLLCAGATAVIALGLFLPVARLSGVWSKSTKPAVVVESRRPRKSQADAVPLGALLQGPIIRPLLMYVVLLWIVYYFVDNIMWANAALRFSDAAQLGAFTGQVVAFYGILAAAMSIFFTGRILSRYGVRNALLLLPVLLTVDMALLALTGLLHAPPAVPFILSTIGKVLVIGLGFSLSSTAFTCLYQPLPPASRGRTQALAEGVLQSLAIGLGGLLLLLLGSVLKFSPVGLACVVVLASAAWIVTIFAIGRQYPLAVTAALSQRRLGEGPGLSLDRDALAILRTRLADDSPAVVLYVLNALEREDPEWPATLEATLPGLLAHPAPEVRQEALQAVGRLGDATAAEVEASPQAHSQLVGVITEHLKSEREPDVCAAGVEAISALRGNAATPFLLGFLESEPTTQAAALTRLLRPPEPPDLAEARLEKLAISPNAHERVQAARVCRAVQRQQDERLMQLLLSDEDVSVRRAALAAMAGRSAGSQLWDGVAAACGVEATAAAAQAALVSGGQACLPAIEAALSGSLPYGGDAERLQRITLAGAAGRIGGAAAVSILEKQADADDGGVRTEALRALSACDYRANGNHASLLDGEVRLAGALAATLASLSGSARRSEGRSPGSPFAASLETELCGVRERVLLLLSFQFDRSAVLAARWALDDGGEARLAYALEAVEMQLPAAFRPRLMPLVELPPAPELAARLRSAGMPVPGWDEAAALAAALRSTSLGEGQGGDRLAGLAPWTQATAIYHAALYSPATLPTLAQLGASSPFALVKETAYWAACRGASQTNGAAAMLSTVEKVLALKRAGMFSQTPSPVLADVARLCDEVEVEAGEQVFAKGEPGDSLYAIVQGRVRVQDGDRVLNDLEEGDVFGELALLDPEPRMASVTALEATRLLRLEQAPFQELIRQQPEVALGVVRVITRYLRARAQDLVRLDAQLNALRNG